MSRRLLYAVVASTLLFALAAGEASAASAHSNGKAKSKAAATVLPATAKLSRGSTTITLSGTLPPSVSVKALRPARTTNASTPSVSFPITNGRATLNASGALTSLTLSHVGGLRITNGSTKITVRNLRIEGSSLTAHVKVGNGRTTRMTIGTVNTSAASVSVDLTAKRRPVTITGVTISLTPQAASLLGVSSSMTATIQTRLNGKPKHDD
jgi:hypothetical protein